MRQIHQREAKEQNAKKTSRGESEGGAEPDGRRERERARRPESFSPKLWGNGAALLAVGPNGEKNTGKWRGTFGRGGGPKRVEKKPAQKLGLRDRNRLLLMKSD